ncbi:MAG: hypothetical protein N2560_00075 [Ignavibacteria bacterium]|nr:hypothetical protein [Ignavibacteria bacterium]
MSINGNIDASSNTIASLPVYFALGSVTETYVDLCELKLFDEQGNQTYYDFETKNGKFKLLVICEEGGKRLVNTNSKTGILNWLFNTNTESYEIIVSLYELGLFKLEVYNILGELTDVIFNEFLSNKSELGKRVLTIHTRKYPKGIYYLIFRSPTNNESYLFLVE